MIEHTVYKTITEPNRLIESARVGHGYLSVVLGDITKEPVDAIVNAANQKLLPGGGVCGAIHKACGDIPFEECQTLHPEGIDIGFAFRSGPGNLLKSNGVSAIIHVVGPDCSNKDQERHKQDLLRNAYHHALEVAKTAGDRTVTIPSISTGNFGYEPLKEAAEIACEAVHHYMRKHPDAFDEVRLIFHSEGEDFNAAVEIVKGY